MQPRQQGHCNKQEFKRIVRGIREMNGTTINGLLVDPYKKAVEPLALPLEVIDANEDDDSLVRGRQ